MSNYNGYKNYQTWNVILWIGNDEGLYALAKESKNYKNFTAALREFETSNIAFETPDNVAWNDSSLDIKAINKAIKEF
jgi:hypothetical protein